MIQTQTLQQIQKLLGYLVKTNVNTTEEYETLLSRVGLLINYLGASIAVKRLSKDLIE